MHAKPSSSLAQKLLFYGVSTGAVALAASAQADTITANISGDNIYFDPASGAFSTTDSSLEFSLTTTTNTKTTMSGTVKTTSIASANGGVALNSNNYVINSPSTIDGSQAYGSGRLNAIGTNTDFPYGTDDTFTPGTSGFIGFDDVINGVDNYGSADITFNGFGVTGGTFTLTDFTTVPEPSSVALLVAGAAGAAVWRRRRQQARHAA